MKKIKAKKFNWEYFKNYVVTYNPSLNAMSDPSIILDDMLYGIGVAINEKDFKWAEGYRKFKEWLTKLINQ